MSIKTKTSHRKTTSKSRARRVVVASSKNRAAPKSRTKKSRAQWAAQIRTEYEHGVLAFLKPAFSLIAAKDDLPRGTFLAMIRRDLAWGILYELTKLSDAEFEAALRSGAISRTMTREQAQQLRAIDPHTKTGGMRAELTSLVTAQIGAKPLQSHTCAGVTS